MRLPTYKGEFDETLLTKISDESFLYQHDANHFELSSSSVALYQLCTQGRSLREIVDVVAAWFPEQNKTTIKKDVVEGIVSLIDAGLVSEDVPEKPVFDAPLLITGSPRSGTTALARNLSTHPRFCIFNEYHLFNCGSRGKRVWKCISTLDKNRPPEKVCRDAATLKARLLEELPIPASDEATRNWLLGIPRETGLVYGDKMPSAYLRNMENIATFFPGAKFLVTLRDGRAVVASQMRGFHDRVRKGKRPEHWMKACTEEAQAMWLRQATIWEKIRHNPPAPCLEVRYERAVEDPGSLARDICEFVGIDYVAGEFEEFFEKYKPVHTDTWKQEFPDIEDKLSDDFLHLLRRFGYESVAPRRPQRQTVNHHTIAQQKVHFRPGSSSQEEPDSRMLNDIKFRMGASYSNTFHKDELIPARTGTLTVTRESVLDAKANAKEDRVRRFQSSIAELNEPESTPFCVCFGDGGRYNGLPPVFASSRPVNCDGVLLWTSMVLRASTTLVADEALAQDIDWKDKSDRCVWRGTTSGGIDKKDRLSGKANRLELVRKFSAHPDFDIGFSKISRSARHMAAELEANGFVKGKMTREEMLRHKYLICVEGNTFSGQLMWAAARKSLVLMPVPVWETIISNGFDPWTHYIPLSSDFSDLEEKVEWCRQHDDQCQEIVARAQSHMKPYTDPERERRINAHILRIYRKNLI